MEKKHKIDYKIEGDIELLEFLFAVLKDKSKNNVKSILKRGNVLVNNRPSTQFNLKLKKGDIVEIILQKIADNKEDVEILYEDEDFFIINKPAGILTVTATEIGEKTAYKIVSEYARRNNLGKLNVVHRLDKETSGVLMFVKDDKLKEQMQEVWNEIVTKRGYIALVEGVVKESGRVVNLIAEARTKLMYVTKDPRIGKEAITNYRVIKTGKYHSLLEVDIETGRKNQIRLHLKELGHPIVGDRKYGAKSNPIRRLGLHANVLEFTNPKNGKKYVVEAPMPLEFESLLRRK